MTDVTQALNNAFGQRQVSTIYNALNQYRVVMEVAPGFAQGPEALDRLRVVAGGQTVPLSAFSTLRADRGARSRQPLPAVRVDVDLVRADARRAA